MLGLSNQNSRYIIIKNVINLGWKAGEMNPLRFDLQHLRAFVMVAEQLHFKKSAELLHMTQPGLTRLIKALEEALQVALFERSTRQVKLTAAGFLFLQETRQVFAHLHRGIDLAQQAKHGDIGHLVIAYNDYAIQDVLPKTLEHFKQQYPHISTDLVYMPTQEQILGLQHGSLDLGFGFAFSEDSEEMGVAWQPVFQDDPVVLLPKVHTWQASAALLCLIWPTSVLWWVLKTIGKCGGAIFTCCVGKRAFIPTQCKKPAP